jgi:DNA polymerase-3 subunit epsilon
MLQYARFIGEWNSYYNSYKWQKLDGGDHTALGDCLATLEVIRVMAGAIKIKKWYEIWIGK